MLEGWVQYNRRLEPSRCLAVAACCLQNGSNDLSRSLLGQLGSKSKQLRDGITIRDTTLVSADLRRLRQESTMRMRNAYCTSRHDQSGQAALGCRAPAAWLRSQLNWVSLARGRTQEARDRVVERSRLPAEHSQGSIERLCTRGPQRFILILLGVGALVPVQQLYNSLAGWSLFSRRH